MFLLDELQERGHVGSSEMIDRLQSREHGRFGQPLEVILADVQHGRPQIELVEELSDKDVNLKDIGDVLLLDISQDVDKPLEVLVRRTDPQEVHLSGERREVLVRE